MFSLLRWLSRRPLRLLHAWGAVLGWLAFALSPTYRRRFHENAAQAGYRFAQVRPAVAQIGRMVAELPRLWLGQTPHFEWDNDACVDAAYAQKKGVLFLTPHLGCFEITAQALALRYNASYGALTVLFRPARKAYLAVGFNRQLIVVMPESGLVVATTGRKNYPFEAMLDLVSATAKSETALPPNPGGVAVLERRLAGIAIETPKASIPSSLAQTLSGKTYRLDSNNLGLKEFTLTFDGNGSYELASYVARGSEETRRIMQPLGLDGRYAATNPDNGLGVFSKAEWTNANTLKIETRRPEEGEALTYVLEFIDRRVVINFSTEFGYRVQLTGTLVD